MSFEKDMKKHIIYHIKNVIYVAYIYHGKDTNCTICFVHVYDETLPLARVRDHDNYEEKHVQDIITNFFLQSDSGLYTNTCHVTRMGEEDRTLLYVMDSSKFPAWISDFGKETGIEKNHE